MNANKWVNYREHIKLNTAKTAEREGSEGVGWADIETEGGNQTLPPNEVFLMNFGWGLRLPTWNRSSQSLKFDADNMSWIKQTSLWAE